MLTGRCISLDTETTGLDLHHGAKPFLITICREDGEQAYWEWDVDPETREPNVLEEDLDEIQAEINSADLIAMHNSVFDVKALQTVFRGELDWDWSKVRDTMCSAHLLDSKLLKNLTTQSLWYLSVDLEPYERKIKEATKAAQSLCRRKYPEIRIAKNGLPEMPSAKEEIWKFDMWLPKALETLGVGEAGWGTACVSYALSDTASTLPLFLRHLELIRERNLEAIYLERLKLLRINYNLEQVGITINRKRKNELTKQYKVHSIKSKSVCRRIAKQSYGYDLELPKSGVNGSLRTFLFDRMKLPVVAKTPKGNPSLNKVAMAVYRDSLEGTRRDFIQTLGETRSRDTAVQYMDGYERFWLPLNGKDDWWTLYPSLNPFGTDTLRWSSHDPNEQNISKKEGFNLRYCFGPAPGREWWSIDYDNLELRIPAYECEEPAMLELFEHPDDPPFYGSYHLLIFSILHPDKYDHDDPEGLIKARDKYKATWYQRTKNGNFAELYGAVDRPEGGGTADKAFGVNGAQKIVAEKLKKKSALNQYWINYANRNGYVETMPDKEVDPDRGYPIVCDRDERGGVKPTIPLNYHVQGTACWIAGRAMVKVQEQLDRLKGDYRMIMNVHDEIVFDFPYRPNYGNKPVIRRVKQIMESVGDCVGVPLTCGVTYHSETWSKGTGLAV